MRKITSFILALALTLSLLVIAGAADQADVHLLVKPDTSSINGNTMKFLVYLELKEGVEVGAAKFKLTAPEGTTFTDVDMNPKYAYDSSSSVEPVNGEGWKKGAFDLSAITSPGSGDIGGGIKDSGQTFEAVLAGTVYKDITVTLNGASVTYEKHMLDKAKCDSYGWLYQLTVTKNSGTFEDGGSYTVGIPTVVNGKSDDFSAGYDTNDPSSPNVSVRHSVSATSTPYTPASTTGVTVSGTAVSWNNTDNAMYLLYSSSTSDADIKAEWKNGSTYTAAYVGTNGTIDNTTVDGKKMQEQSFTFTGVASGDYKLVIFKQGGYVPKIVPINVGASDYPCGQIKLWLYGDVTYDGAIDGDDVFQMNRYIARKTSVFTRGTPQDKLDCYAAANITALKSSDNVVDGDDVFQVNRFLARKTSMFSLIK